MNATNVFQKLQYSLKFFLMNTKPKNKKELSLYCRILLNRTKSDFSLEMNVNPNDWDSELGRFKATTKQLHYLNFKLSEVEGKIQDIYYALEKQKLKIVASNLKDIFKGKKLDNTDYSLLSFLDYFIAEAKTKPQVYGLPTINHYYALKSHLEMFFKSMRIKDVQLENFNRNMLDRFETWLLTWKHPILDRAMNRNTANRYLTKLKVVINNAIRKEIITKSPFVGFTIKEVYSNKVFLTEDELDLIRKHDLGNNASLIRVRDMFFFSVYTGLRFSDSLSLKDSAISKGQDGNFWITINQIKTKDPLHIPLLKPAEDVYNKYGENRRRTGYVLPRLSNQKLNLNLKEICKLVGINKKITYHVGRHTFATTITMEKNVDIKTVSKWLGHSSIKSTEVYAQVTKTQISNTAQRLNDGIKQRETIPKIKDS